MVDTIYPAIGDLPHPPDQYFCECMLLSARNEDVHKINNQILAKFPGNAQVFHSADSISTSQDGDDILYPSEYLNSINISGLPLSKLTLKIGCPIMILCNLYPAQGVCNGT